MTKFERSTITRSEECCMKRKVQIRLLKLQRLSSQSNHQAIIRQRIRK